MFFFPYFPISAWKCFLLVSYDFGNLSLMFLIYVFLKKKEDVYYGLFIFVQIYRSKFLMREQLKLLAK